ncbi:type I polyketide synthase [Pseudovibrio exalbescens]|uniref:type I polyketide synthase n=1 Tax=Pseudovibrio exalbescens TaxID=197461 RepID=UPI000C9AB92F|nr:type I polyketide synthase [Pseudovibrio exalbescens]
MIEIVGWSLRVPGSSTKSELWTQLKNGVCSVSEIPADRWNSFRYLHPRYSEPGKTYSFAAGVLDDVWGFDPGLFGISPREAEQMDPQQRILLELTWEAIEDAGVAPSSLSGGNVGVFVGASALDYGAESLFDPSVATGHFMTGNTLSIVANRLSYIFDFKGPSFSVDTACSSSLVALNEAVDALNAGRIDTAIVAGVNVLASPFPFVGFAQATMLSPEGLCRAFDADGKGYVRAEGGLVFVLRRQDADRWPGQRSHADIVGVDINSDGRTVGMSLPSADYQAALLKRIYDHHHINPQDLAFIEAHGTGTRVGDPAEAESIGTILGQRRSTPLPIGSVKTNIGHLEPASGLAGVAKAILALENNYLPPSLHFETPNPDIDFEGLNLSVITDGIGLARGQHKRYAGVNSFGFGGTNAHVILSDPAQPDVVAHQNSSNDGAGILMLSAQSKEALAELAKTYATRCDAITNDEDLAGLQSAAYYRRQNFGEKLLVVGSNPAQTAQNLREFATGKTSEQVIHAQTQSNSGSCAFAFSGNGAQWAGMGRCAYQRNTAFRAAFQQIDKLFESLSEWSLKDQLFAEDLAERLKKTSVAQPLLFATQVALCRALAAYGLKPDMVLGHSIGEVAAAEVAGILSLEDAVALVFNRSIHQETVAGSGTMAALVLPADQAQAAIDESGLPTLGVAAVNSPKSVTVSGSYEDIEAFGRFAKSKRYVFRKIALDYPFHSALIDPVEAPFRDAMPEISPKQGSVAFYSTVSGKRVEGHTLTKEYWWQNLRQTVQFVGAVEAALDDGARYLIEIGPKPILQGYMKQIAAEAESTIATLDSLSQSEPDHLDPVLQILARAMAAGVAVDEHRVFGENPASSIELPTYAFQHKTFRFQGTSESNIGLFRGGYHCLLGWRANAEVPVWTTHLDSTVVPFLADHVINGHEIFPGAGYVEMMLAAAQEVYGQEEVEVQTLDILQALHLSHDYLVEVQTRLSPETGTVEIFSRRRLSDDAWMLNATGRVFQAISEDDARAHDHNRPAELVAARDEIYDRAHQYGLEFGPHFQRARTISKLGPDRLRVQLQSLRDDGLERGNFGIHPAELDGCFHGLLALFKAASEDDLATGQAYVPIHFASIRQARAGGSPAVVDLRVRRVSSRSIHADFRIFDEDGTALLIIKGGRFRATELGRKDNPADLIYRHETRYRPLHGQQEAPDALAQLQVSFAPKALTQQNLHIGAETEEKESSLLLEAAAQRVAYDTLAQACKDGEIDLSTLPEDHKLYFRQLMQILLDVDGAVQLDGHRFRLTDGFELPDFDVLVRSVLHDNPEEVASATLISQARRNISRLISAEDGVETEASAALLDHFWFSSPAALARTAALEAWLTPFLEAWPADRPLRVLELSGSGLNVARFIANRVDHSLLSITVAEPDHRCAARLQATEPATSVIRVCDVSEGWADVLQTEAYDVVLSSGRLHLFQTGCLSLEDVGAALSQDGRFIAVESPPEILQDVVFGIREQWFANSLSSEFPLGPMMGAQAWQDHLSGCGLRDVDTHQCTVNGCALTLVSAWRNSPGIETKDHDEVSVEWLLVTGKVPAAAECTATLESLAASHGISLRHLEIDPRHEAVQDEGFWAARLEEINPATELTVIDLTSTFGIDSTPTEALTAKAMMYRAFSQAAGTRELRTILVASGGASAPNTGHASAVQSAIWTFARTLSNEAPELNPTLLDVSLQQDADRLAREIFRGITSLAGETEGVVTGSTLAVPRVVRGFSRKAWKPGQRMELSFDRSGSLDNLHWKAMPDREIGAQEVEIEVAATGLNFRDVMWTLGMLPEEALEDGYGGPALGLEVSGTVTRVGQGVTTAKTGDRVIAFTSGGFATHVMVPEFSIAPLPEDHDLIAAATVPVAFLTAYYSLIHLARLREDQWVLIHGGAGGVGLAALQIAKWAGARVIATAGSDEKRDLLKILGADHVLDSRSLHFAHEVMELTGGDGVDAVLNSLAGEAMERSLQTLRPFGSFLELGKRDYYANTKIGLRPFRRNLTYFGIDLDQILLHDKTLMTRLIKEVFALLKDQVFTPLPHRRFEARSVQDAFRLMQRSGHIGKIIVVPPQEGEIKVPAPGDPVRFSSTGTHLVVGGLGGFGGQIANWLADRGARHIVLTSRRGQASEEHQRLIETLAAKGVLVEARACDVTDRGSLEGLLADLRQNGAIKGVIHAAMVLDDGILTSLDADRFARVLEPKVHGAALLDELTRDDPIEQFILFSSATTMIGNPGQSNYVAANGYLEGLARKRRLQGLPAVAVGWGAIGDVGFLARNQDVSGKLSRHLGAATIRAREGLDVLAMAMASDGGGVDDAVMHIGRFDWSTALSTLPLLKSPSFDQLTKQFGSTADSQDQLDLEQLVAGKSEREAVEIISKLLAGEIGRILRLPPEEIGSKKPLAEFGMDSLMGLELRMGIQQRFGVEIPLVSITGGTCIEDFALQILKRLGNEAASGSTASSSHETLASQHVSDDLSDEQKQAVQKALESQGNKVASILQ